MIHSATLNSASHIQQMHIRVFSKDSAEKIAKLGKKALEALLNLIMKLSRIIAAPFRIGSGLAAGNSSGTGSYGNAETNLPHSFGAHEHFRGKDKFPKPIVEQAPPNITAQLSEMGFVNDDGASDALLFAGPDASEKPELVNVLAGKNDIFLVLEGAPEDLKLVYQPILERISLVLDWNPSQFVFEGLNDEAIPSVVELAEDSERLQAALKLTEMQMLLVSQNSAKSPASEYDSKENDVLSYIIEIQQQGAKQEDFPEGSVEGDLFRIVCLSCRFKNAIAAREDFLVEILNQAKNNAELFSKIERSISDGRDRIREKTGVKPAADSNVQVSTSENIKQESPVVAPTITDEVAAPAATIKQETQSKVLGGMFSNSEALSPAQIVNADSDFDSDFDLTGETEFVG